MSQHHYIARSANRAAGSMWCKMPCRAASPDLRNQVLYFHKMPPNSPEFVDAVISIFEQIIPLEDRPDFANLAEPLRRHYLEQVQQRAQEIEKLSI